MKLIIDIPEDYYKKIKDIKPSHYTAKIYLAVQKGTILSECKDCIPREKIDEMIAEIKGYCDEFGWYDGDLSDLSDDFLSIIHKYCDKEQNND